MLRACFGFFTQPVNCPTIAVTVINLETLERPRGRLASHAVVFIPRVPEGIFFARLREGSVAEPQRREFLGDSFVGRK